MCGIAGFYHTQLGVEDYPDTVKRMLGYITHRGPDELGYYVDNHVALGTSRLSVIDLNTGQQPVSDGSQRYWICYNGEIYNYKELKQELQSKGHVFATDCDTEVVLYAWIQWGLDAFERFNGGFALAIYDRLEQELVLARDRYGKRPLFYSAWDGGVLFASEMKCFFGYDGFSFDFDDQKLASLFRLWTPLPTHSPFKGIEQLSIGGYVRIKGEHRQTGKYARLQLNRPMFDGTLDEGIERTVEKLKESVRLRLRSDVEVGTYLSGGLDSAIVTYLAGQEVNRKLHTFSVSFEQEGYDESDYQRELIDWLGTCHHSLRVSNSVIAEHFKDMVWHAEVPQFRTASVPMWLLSQEVQRCGIKVVLTGEGADEAFVGYNIFKESMLRAQWNEGIGPEEKQQRLQNLYPYIKHFNEKNAKALMGMYQQYAQEKIPGLFSHELRYNNSRLALKLLDTQEEGLKELLALIQEHGSEYASYSVIQKAQWLEYHTLLAGYLLSSQGDRMSLAHGVENRCAFLDPNVINWANRLPEQWKLHEGVGEKYILKQAFKDKLPLSVIGRHKQPYRAPDARVFVENKTLEELESILSHDQLCKLDCVNAIVAKRLVEKVLNGDGNHISPREDQAFVLLLSLALLNHYFVLRHLPEQADVKAQWVKQIDFREHKHSV